MVELLHVVVYAVLPRTAISPVIRPGLKSPHPSTVMGLAGAAPVVAAQFAVLIGSVVPGPLSPHAAPSEVQYLIGVVTTGAAKALKFQEPQLFHPPGAKLVEQIIVAEDAHWPTHRQYRQRLWTFCERWQRAADLRLVITVVAAEICSLSIIETDESIMKPVGTTHYERWANRRYVKVAVPYMPIVAGPQRPRKPSPMNASTDNQCRLPSARLVHKYARANRADLFTWMEAFMTLTTKRSINSCETRQKEQRRTTRWLAS